MPENGGELGEGKLLGSSVGTKAAALEGRLNPIIIGDGKEIVAKGLALLAEADVKKGEEPFLVSQMEAGAFARQFHAQECGGDARARTKCARRNPHDDLGFGIELAKRGEVAEFAASGTSHDARGDLELNDDVNRFDLIGPAEQVMEDWRSNVVWQVAVNTELAVSEVTQIEGQHVRAHDFDARPIGGIGVSAFA